MLSSYLGPPPSRPSAETEPIASHFLILSTLYQLRACPYSLMGGGGGEGGRTNYTEANKPSIPSLYCSTDKLVGISQQMYFSALHTIYMRRNIVHIYLCNNSFYKHCEVQ